MVAVVAAVVQQLEEGKESSSKKEALTHTKHRNTLNSRYVKRMLG